MDKDLERIKQYQKDNDPDAFNYFWEKYHSFLQKTCYKLIKSKFFSVPIEFDDLTSTIYFSIKNTLKTFNLEQNKYTIGQALFTTAISTIRRQAVKYTNNGHSILNKALSLDSNNYLENYQKNSVDNESQWICDYDAEDKITRFKEKTNNFHNQLTRKIIDMKIDGLKNKEIAKKLKIDVRKVANTLCYLKRKYDELY